MWLLSGLQNYSYILISMLFHLSEVM